MDCKNQEAISQIVPFGSCYFLKGCQDQSVGWTMTQEQYNLLMSISSYMSSSVYEGMPDEEYAIIGIRAMRDVADGKTPFGFDHAVTPCEQITAQELLPKIKEEPSWIDNILGAFGGGSSDTTVEKLPDGGTKTTTDQGDEVIVKTQTPDPTVPGGFKTTVVTIKKPFLETTKGKVVVGLAIVGGLYALYKWNK